MTRSPLLLLTMVLGCSTAPTTTPTDPQPRGSAAKPAEVTVELASVTLADECGDAAKPPPPPTKLAEAKTTKAAPPEAEMSISAGSCATPGGCPAIHRDPCQQTSMQLSVHAPAMAQPTTLRVKQVELVDEQGKVVGVLTSRKPSRWATDQYVTWDEAIAADQTLAASYLLTAPDWNTLTNGKWNAHTKRYNLRVTFVLGTAERIVEKQRIQPATILPEIET